MVRVTTTDEAAAVVHFAACHHVPFAVKGGGYSTTGASITRGGIVLDLSNLRKVHVDPISKEVTAQGGALWEDIDFAASQYNLAVVGSTLNQIGAAGATLGGGYGWLTGQYGLAIDNLLWARMIMADGSVIIASEEQHPDLLWAIRGAGQSFGVAIELSFRAHIQDHPVFAGTLLFSVEKLPAIVDFATQFEILTNGKQGFWFGFTRPLSTAQCFILVVVFYNGTQTAAEEFFSPLFSLRPEMNETQMLPYDSLNSILNVMHLVAHHGSLNDIALPVDESVGSRKSLGGSNITLPLDIEFVKSIYNQFDGILREYPQVRDSTLLFELLPNAQIVRVPNDATAFASRGPYYNVSSLFSWRDANLDVRMHSLQRDLMNQIGTCAGIAGQHDYNTSRQGTGIYANYAGMLIGAGYIVIHSRFELKRTEKKAMTNKIAGHDLPIAAIFGDNLPRLRELKKKYDPHNIFRKWHDINEPMNTLG